MLKASDQALALGVRVGHNIENIGGMPVTAFDDPRDVAQKLVSSERPLTMLFSNNRHVNSANEAEICNFTQQVNNLKVELIRLSRAGEFKSDSFVANVLNSKDVSQEYERTHTEYKNTQKLVVEIAEVCERAKSAADFAQEQFERQYNIVRRHNPLSSKRAQVEEAHQQLIDRWQVIHQQLDFLHASAQALQEKRAPQICQRRTRRKAKTVLKSDPSWVHGAADVEGVPSILSFYP